MPRGGGDGATLHSSWFHLVVTSGASHPLALPPSAEEDKSELPMIQRLYLTCLQVSQRPPPRRRTNPSGIWIAPARLLAFLC